MLSRKNISVNTILLDLKVLYNTMINQYDTKFKANTITTTTEQKFSELTHIFIVWWLSTKCQEYTLGKWTSSINGEEKTRHSRTKLNFCLTLYIKINSTWISPWHEILKAIEVRLEGNFHCGGWKLLVQDTADKTSHSRNKQTGQDEEKKLALSKRKIRQYKPTMAFLYI